MSLQYLNGTPWDICLIQTCTYRERLANSSVASAVSYVAEKYYKAA